MRHSKPAKLSHPSPLTHLQPIIIITISLSSALPSKSVWLIWARLALLAQPRLAVTAVIALILSKQLSARFSLKVIFHHHLIVSTFNKRRYTRSNNNAISNNNTFTVKTTPPPEDHLSFIFKVVYAGRTHC